MTNAYELSALQQYLQYKSLQNYAQRPAIVSLPVRTPNFYQAYNHHQQYIANTMPMYTVIRPQIQPIQPSFPWIQQFTPLQSFSHDSKLADKLAELSKKTASPDPRPEQILEMPKQDLEKKNLTVESNGSNQPLELLSTGAANSPSNKQDDLQAKKKKRSPATKDVPFECIIPGCGKNYGSKTALKSHIKQKHTVVIECIVDTNDLEPCKEFANSE